MSFVADLRMPFTSSTLQIRGYLSYQHRKLQAAQLSLSDTVYDYFTKKKQLINSI